MAGPSLTSNGSGSPPIFGRRARHRFGIAGIDDDVRAVRGQGLGHGEAEATRRPGNQGDAAVEPEQVGHALTPLPGRATQRADRFRGRRRVQRTRTVIKVAGRSLAVQHLPAPGPVDRPTLVFLHEGLGSIALWRDFPTQLCHRLGLPGLVYDRWGHGQSEPLDGPRSVRYLHDEAELYLPGVLEQSGVERPLLIGHSDGGTIALLFAARFPERAAAVVAEAAHVFVEDITVAGIRRGWPHICRRPTSRPGSPAIMATRRIRSFAPGTIAGWRPSSAAGTSRPSSPASPVLCWCSRGRRMSTGPWSRSRRSPARFRVPHGPCMLPGIGHTPHHEAAGQVLDLMASFVQSQLG